MYSLSLIFSLTTAILGIQGADKNFVPPKPTRFAPLEKTVAHKLGDRTISFKVVQYGDYINTCCVNLHDDEMTAVRAARLVLEKQGGILIKIENNSKRNISFPFKGVQYSFDPNRIFSRDGIKLTLRAKGKINPLAIDEVEKFAKRLLQLIPDSVSCLIALHNNADGDYSVKTYQPGGKRQSDARQVYANTWQDVDDISFTTDEIIYTKMAALGYNSILQDNEKVYKDGSLSVYYGDQNRRYINIETQHGKTAQYGEMLKKLLYILEEEKKAVASPPVIETD